VSSTKAQAIDSSDLQPIYGVSVGQTESPTLGYIEKKHYDYFKCALLRQGTH